MNPIQRIHATCANEELHYALMQEEGPFTEEGLEGSLAVLLLMEAEERRTIENRIDELQHAILNGRQDVSRAAAVEVFARWMRAGRWDDIKTAFRNAGRIRMNYSNDDLEARALAKGLDPHAVCERAAIMEIDGGLPRWQAAAYALGECASVEELKGDAKDA